MQGILKNKNIKSIETDVNSNGIKIEMKLKNSIVNMNKFAVFNAIFDFDDFIKSIFIDSKENNYLTNDDYNYQLLTIDNKTNEQMLFSLLYEFILSFKNNKIDYSYYGYYTKKITNDILITYKTDKNKIGIEINKYIFNKNVFDDWN